MTNADYDNGNFNSGDIVIKTGNQDRMKIKHSGQVQLGSINDLETEINNKSSQSHYFIKFTNNKTLDDNLEKLKLIKFNFNNTVGPKSISKPELINEFNKLLIYLL